MPKFNDKLWQTIQLIIVSVVMVGFIGIAPVALAEDAVDPTNPTSITDVLAPTSPEPTPYIDQPVDEITTLNQPSESQSTPPEPTPTPIDILSEASITNQVAQATGTGDANLASSDDIANTATGTSDNSLNLLNVANNLLGDTGTEPVLYVNNIEGNFTGNITIDPSLLIAPVYSDTPVLTLPIYNDPNNTVVVTSTTLDNNVTMDSASGNAILEGNDDVGNTTTGDALNDANIVNVANTIIGTGSYFVGIINVYGDLTGDIIIPASLIDTLNQTYGLDPNQSSFNLNTTNTTDITNNATMNAETGQITLYGNDDIGSATTGNALNNLKILNYTGLHIFTDNTLLIIVNVMGQWLGLLLGQSDTNSVAVSASNPTNNIVPQAEPISLSYNATTKITNNLLMNAISGDASIINNDDVGNTSTGNATNTARIMNVASSTLSLAHWFGVLFINILGNWYGSVVTPAMAADTTNQVSTTAYTAPTPVNKFTNKFAGLPFYAPAYSSSTSPIAETPEETVVLSQIKDLGTMDLNQIASQPSQSWLWAILCAILGTSVLAAEPIARLRATQ